MQNDDDFDEFMNTRHGVAFVICMFIALFPIMICLLYLDFMKDNFTRKNVASAFVLIVVSLIVVKFSIFLKTDLFYTRPFEIARTEMIEE